MILIISFNIDEELFIYLRISLITATDRINLKKKTYTVHFLYIYTYEKNNLVNAEWIEVRIPLTRLDSFALK